MARSKILSSILLLLLSGCYTQRGNSEFGIKQSTTWSIYQRTEVQVDEQVSSFEWNIKPLIEGFVDWLFGSPEPEVIIEIP